MVGFLIIVVVVGILVAVIGAMVVASFSLIFGDKEKDLKDKIRKEIRDKVKEDKIRKEIMEEER